MLQRNPGPDPVDVPAIPATVGPGDTVDWPHPIAGFEPAEPDPIPDPALDVLAKPRASRTAAATGEE